MLIRSFIVSCIALGAAAFPATAAERAVLVLSGTVLPYVGVTVQVDPLAPMPVGGVQPIALATFNSAGNSLFQLLLMSDAGVGAETAQAGTEVLFNGAPLQFTSGVALLNGMRVTEGGNQRESGQLLIGARAAIVDPNGQFTFAPLDEVYTLVVRAP